MKSLIRTIVLILITAAVAVFGYHEYTVKSRESDTETKMEDIQGTIQISAIKAFPAYRDYQIEWY